MSEKLNELEQLLLLRKHYDDTIGDLNRFFPYLISIMLGFIPFLRQTFKDNPSLTLLFVFISLFTVYINLSWLYAIYKILGSLEMIRTRIILAAEENSFHHLSAMFTERKFSKIVRHELTLPLGFIIMAILFCWML